MRKKTIGISLLLAALHLVFTSKAQNVPVFYQTPLLRSLQATGAECNAIRVRGTGRLDMLWQPKTWEGLCTHIASNLSFSEAELAEAAATWEDNSYRWNVTTPKRQLEIVFEPEKKELLKGTYTATLYYTTDFFEENDLLRANLRVREIMGNLSAKPSISTCLQGYIDGKLKDDELKRDMEDGFAAIGAQILHRYETPEAFYYSGTSLYMDESFTGGDGLSNMGIDARYHSKKNQTVFMVGPAALFTKTAS